MNRHPEAEAPPPVDEGPGESSPPAAAEPKLVRHRPSDETTSSNEDDEQESAGGEMARDADVNGETETTPPTPSEGAEVTNDPADDDVANVGRGSSAGSGMKPREAGPDGPDEEGGTEASSPAAGPNSARNPYMARAAAAPAAVPPRDAETGDDPSDALQSTVRAATLCALDPSSSTTSPGRGEKDGGASTATTKEQPRPSAADLAAAHRDPATRRLLIEKDTELDEQFRRRCEAETEASEAKKLLERERTRVQDLLAGGGGTGTPRRSAAARSELSAQKTKLDDEIKKRKWLQIELERTKETLVKAKEAAEATARRTSPRKSIGGSGKGKGESAAEGKIRRGLELELETQKKLLEKQKKKVEELQRGKVSVVKKRLNDETAARKRAEDELNDARDWNVWLSELIEYREKNGHCQVPATQGGGRKGSLGYWVKRVRLVHAEEEAGKREDGEGLSDDQVAVLESIGFWDDPPAGTAGRREKKPAPVAAAAKGRDDDAKIVYEDAADGDEEKPFWDDFYRCLQKYRIDEGDCLIPFTFDGGLKGSLGYWVARVRKLRQEQQDGARKQEWLTDERIKSLDSIDFEWSIDDGGKASAKKAPLKKAQDDLEEEREWNAYFARLLKFRADAGDCLVPAAQDGGRKGSLGWWVTKMRQLHKMEEGERSERGLTDARIAMLESVGFVFSVRGSGGDGAAKKDLNDFTARKQAETDLKGERFWSDMFLQLLQYKKERGNTLIPTKHGGGKVGSLGHWAARLRKFKAEQDAGTREPEWLTQKRIDMLNAVDFSWVAARGKTTNALKADDVAFWNDFFSSLLQYRAEHGDCAVPRNHDADLKGGLGYWVARVRTLKQEQEAGRREQGWLTDRRIEMLNQSAFDWAIKRNSDGSQVESSTGARRGLSVEDEESWEDLFLKLVEYKAEHGDCRVGRKVGGGKKGSLGYWVKRQRIVKQLQDAGKLTDGTLAEDQIQKMTDIGFVWAGPPKTAWDDRFLELQQYRELHGHVCPPTHPRTPLGNWVCHQRDRYKRLQSKLRWIQERGTEEGWTPDDKRAISIITPEEIEKLESVGFVWSMLARPYLGWDAQFQELIEYFNENGHSNVPQSYKGQQNLGRWVMRQRGFYLDRQRGKLSSDSTMMSDERISKLESLNFCWNRLDNTQGTKRKRDDDDVNDGVYDARVDEHISYLQQAEAQRAEEQPAEEQPAGSYQSNVYQAPLHQSDVYQAPLLQAGAAVAAHESGMHQAGAHESGEYQAAAHESGEYQAAAHESGEYQAGVHYDGVHQIAAHRTEVHQVAAHRTEVHQVAAHRTEVHHDGVQQVAAHHDGVQQAGAHHDGVQQAGAHQSEVHQAGAHHDGVQQAGVYHHDGSYKAAEGRHGFM